MEATRSSSLPVPGVPVMRMFGGLGMAAAAAAAATVAAVSPDER
jgi:hypothetical protein